MRKTIHLLILFFVIISCSKSDEQPEVIKDSTPKIEEGKQVFRLDVKDITSKTASISNQKILEPTFVLITIKNKIGTTILSREKVSLTKVEDSYLTNEISLEAGTYSLIEFIVVDEDDIVITMAPKEYSILAQFTNNPLPFEFVVSPNEINETLTENINTAGYVAVDFGYTGLSLSFSENTEFFTMTVNDTESLTAKNIMLESITGSVFLIDWGDDIIEEYVSNLSGSGIENTASHIYDEKGTYTITISGAIRTIELLKVYGNSDFQHKTNLSSIQIENISLLKSCSLYTGELSSIDVSNNIALEKLELGNNRISSLDITNNPNLKDVRMRMNLLTSLDTSNNTNLEYLSLRENLITNLDISNNKKLIGFSAVGNLLTQLDISRNVDLVSLELSDNLIPYMDLTNNEKMLYLNIGANKLTSIDVSKNVNLRRIDLYHNQLSSLDISNNTNLENLYVNGNSLSTLDLTNNPKLDRLIIDHNNFSTLDLSHTPKIFSLKIGSNQFDSGTLDEIISQIHERAIANNISDGYMDFQNNPGFDNISNTSLSKINELISSYSWFFNNN